MSIHSVLTIPENGAKSHSLRSGRRRRQIFARNSSLTDKDSERMLQRYYEQGFLARDHLSPDKKGAEPVGSLISLQGRVQSKGSLSFRRLKRTTPYHPDILIALETQVSQYSVHDTGKSSALTL
jgi:hypothetical protein